MKKGFTLTELVAVIGLIAVISLIFVPSVIDLLDEESSDIYKIKEKQMVSAATDYVNYEKSFVKPVSTEKKYILLSELVSKSYLNNIVDNTSHEICEGYVVVSVNDIAYYDYEACLICSGYTTSSDNCSYAIYQELGD